MVPCEHRLRLLFVLMIVNKNVSVGITVISVLFHVYEERWSLYSCSEVERPISALFYVAMEQAVKE